MSREAAVVPASTDTSGDRPCLIGGGNDFPPREGIFFLR